MLNIYTSFLICFVSIVEKLSNILIIQLIVALSKVFYFLTKFIIGSYIQSAAKKLNSKLSVALAKIYCLYANKKHVLAEEDWIREARQVAYTQLIRLKKVCEKVWLKEFYLVKQGL